MGDKKVGVVEESKQEVLEKSIEVAESSESNQADDKSVQEQAQEQGWDPKGELSADEFVRRGSLFKKIHSQSAQIRELKDTLQKLSSHISASEKSGYERAIVELTRQRDQAVLSGDLDTVKTLDKQTEIMKEQVKVASVPPVKEYGPEEIEFADRNKSWFNSDPSNQELVSTAIYFDNYLVNSNKDLAPDERLKMVENRIRQLYPDKFSNPKKNTPAAVGTSTGSSKETSSSKLVSKMSNQQREIGEQFMKQIPGYTMEKYAKELERQGNLGK